jgi:branched-chain amino acid transport system permease protein
MPDKKRQYRLALFIVIALFLTAAPPFIGLTYVSLLTKFIIFALLAMSLDIIFGYTGLWSFGHAALFGVGAYTTGILIIHYGITSFWLSAPAGILMATLVAAIFGVIALRVSGLYFLIVTLALGQLIYGIVMEWGPMTGGYDGLWNVPPPDIGITFTSLSYYYFTLVIVAICAFVLYLITKSPFGHSLQGIRESETRMRCLGYNTWLYKFIAFIIGGLFAGVAGVLYVHFNGAVCPANVGLASSGIVMLMLIIGGSGRLWGAVIGSVVFLSLEYFVSLFTPARWPLIMGASFIGVAMLLRGGLWPHINRLWGRANQS